MARLLVVILLTVNLVSCSTHVSSQEVPGNYAVSHPFGKAHLVLNQDGTFEQRVSITGHPVETVKGSWKFDPGRSTMMLHGIMPVVDAFGDLERDWKKIDDLDEVPVERLWFKIEIELNESYGYVKQ